MTEEKLKRMSNAPIDIWPTPLLNTQCAFIYNRLFGISILEAAEISQSFETNNDRIEFIKANEDMIEKSKR